ncbi:leucine-rich repeat extensin-like protein 3 [Impatiens glandulifera]|uniref:leucine-rich repeat extensin-like protein 3 n=1 Tax=Impatiens glandulifera TaxID=253017 RepID=UPI001FB114F4|nr:leucine-rich repeat extensin-like protein 3 [Impatiens glandulifera]
MEKPQKLKLFYSLAFLLAFLLPPTKPSPTSTTANTWIGSKYQIECTMCSACDDPCNPPALYSPPPPPPPPSNPPINYPPPPSPPTSTGNKYYSPPPPTANYYYYPPPNTGSYYYYPPPPYVYFPRPPPPNPIVGYFPFYSHNPPPQFTAAASFHPPCSLIVQILTLFLGLILFC